MANEENICKCECVRAMTRKERYQHFRKGLSASIEEIRTAENMGGLIKSINLLENKLEHAKNDTQLHDVRGYVEDILGTIRSIKMRDCTRNDLVKLLEATVDCCDEILAGETHNEHVDRARSFFLQCAEHAEDLSDLIDFSKLFGND